MKFESYCKRGPYKLCCVGTGLRRGTRRITFQLRKYLPQGADQFVARNMALLELNPKLELLIFRLVLKQKRLRPLRPGDMLLALPARLIAREPALHKALNRFHHLLF